MKRKGYPWHFGDIWRSACQYPTSYLNTMPPQYNAASIQCRLNTLPPQYNAASIQCRPPTSSPFRLLHHSDFFAIATASPFRLLRHFEFFAISTSSPFRLLRHLDFFAIPTSSPSRLLHPSLGIGFSKSHCSGPGCLGSPSGIVLRRRCIEAAL